MAVEVEGVEGMLWFFERFLVFLLDATPGRSQQDQAGVAGRRRRRKVLARLDGPAGGDELSRHRPGALRP